MKDLLIQFLHLLSGIFGWSGGATRNKSCGKSRRESARQNDGQATLRKSKKLFWVSRNPINSNYNVQFISYFLRLQDLMQLFAHIPMCQDVFVSFCLVPPKAPGVKHQS